MGVDDFMDREAGIIAAATAAAVSPRARDLFRRGAVYGLAGVLRTGDLAAAAAKGAVRSVRAESGGSPNGSRRQPTSSRQTSGNRRSPQASRSTQGTRGTASRGTKTSRGKQTSSRQRSSRG